jgi:hypothetical protein
MMNEPGSLDVRADFRSAPDDEVPYVGRAQLGPIWWHEFAEIGDATTKAPGEEKTIVDVPAGVTAILRVDGASRSVVGPRRVRVLYVGQTIEVIDAQSQRGEV